LKINKDMFI